MSDVLYDGVSFTVFTDDRIPTTSTHGPVNHLFGWWTAGGAKGKGGATHSVTRESA